MRSVSFPSSFASSYFFASVQPTYQYACGRETEVAMTETSSLAVSWPMARTGLPRDVVQVLVMVDTMDKVLSVKGITSGCCDGGLS